MQKTTSIWSYIDLNIFDFLNPLYDEHRASSAQLAPHPSQVKFWSGTRSNLSLPIHGLTNNRVLLYVVVDTLHAGGTEYFLRWACHSPAERAIKDIHVLRDFSGMDMPTCERF